MVQKFATGQGRVASEGTGDHPQRPTPVIVLRPVGLPPPTRLGAKRPAEFGVSDGLVVELLFCRVVIELRQLFDTHPGRRQP